jgi:hypothetical protein
MEKKLIKKEGNPFELPKALPDDVFYQSLEPKNKKMENKFLQSVERYTNKEQGKTGYKAIYSNGLDFETLLFPIKNGVDNINIPSIVKSVMTIAEIESIGAELLTFK